MSDINLTYTSPQDKLLIMLLERISTLEDVVNKLVSISTSDVFTVIISGKYVDGGYEDLITIQDVIKTIINDIVPCHNIYAHITQYFTQWQNNSGGTLLLHTRDSHTLRDIETLLTEKLRKVVNVQTWQMKSRMEILKNTEFAKDFTIIP